MKKYFTFLASLFIFITGFSQSGLTCSHHKSSRGFTERSNTLSLEYIALTEEYDVHFYFLDVALENTSTDISGSTEIHVTSKVAVLDTFLFELHEDLVITDILLNGLTSTPFTRVGSAVIVPVNFTTGDAFFMKIIYGGTPPTPFTNPLGGAGMTQDNSPSWGNEVTWTLSEPFSAFEWFPCKQSLNDKADSAYTFVTTSSTNMAGSNGVLTAVTDMGGGLDRYEWKTRYPIDYYLISIAVAEYVDYTIYANPVGAPAPIMIQNFVYNNPACLPYFQSEIDNTADFIEYFSTLYGLYPFHEEKYGHCMAPISGGMEHQTMTTQGWFEDGLTVHEMGHQWFGDNVTCASWSDIWLNEGFASYTEHLMWEYFYPGDELSDMQSRHDDIMSAAGGSVWVLDSLDAGAIFSGRLVYNKGAAIIHTMRFLINDDAVFFDILQTYQQTFADSTAHAANLKEIMETISGIDFTNYFNEWYYGQGYPTYSIEWNQINSAVFIQLNQITSMPGVTPFFTNDLEIALTDVLGNTTIYRLADIDGSSTFHTLFSPGEIVNIEIDPNNYIINADGTIIENTSLVGIDEKSESVLSVYPSPATTELTVESTETNFYQLINSMGQVVATGNLIAGKNNIDISNLSSGVYLIKTSTEQKRFVKK
ncbi:MAG: T9SS type A sorting domain-containing protein [Crocinitomicaceae bacterium]|nr:T9SS type A sorting domain-containing protein [Crocinitomicaceae bacterium]